MDRELKVIVILIVGLVVFAVCMGGCTERASLDYDQRVLYDRLTAIHNKCIQLDNKIEVMGTNIVDIEYQVRWRLADMEPVLGYSYKLEN